MSKFPIAPKDVRFIKLGRKGSWEADCRERGILRFGWCTAEADVITRCRSGKWNELAQAHLFGVFLQNPHLPKPVLEILFP